jgi:DmsE family decaheme c-type cytochrome
MNGLRTCKASVEDGGVNVQRGQCTLRAFVALFSVVCSALIYLLLLGDPQSAYADGKQPSLAEVANSKSPHHPFDDAELGALRDYAKQVAADQPKLASAAESKAPNPHHADDAQLSALREYAQQIGSEQPQGVSAEEGANPHRQYNHYDDASIAALRDYARQIGADQSSPAGAPPFKVAEADNAFDALRNFLGGGSQQDAPRSTAPTTSPSRPPPQPKRAPVITPKHGKPAAPRGPGVVFASGGFLGPDVCVMCHSVQAEAFGKTLMGRIDRTKQPGKFACENCHGPGLSHVKAVGCDACHGEGGVSRWPGMPSLVGQYPDYLVPAMRSYQNGQRQHGLMRAILTGVSEGELNRIALHYAHRPAAPAQTPLTGDPGAGSGAIGVCAGCHGTNGVSVDPSIPSLAGQDSQYLADAIHQYQTGQRTKAIACAACHGAGGVSRRPGMPSLVAQSPEYLVPAMEAYINGERKHPLMHALLTVMGRGELNGIANFYARQSPARAQTPLVGDPSAGKAASGLCAECHGEEASVDPAWPTLAGQDSRYLATAIRAYQHGAREKIVACAGCHGEGGVSKRAGIPSLVGLDAQYLVAAMKGYVSGQRKGEIMKALLTGVSDAELNKMAGFYTQQTPARASTPSIGDPAAGKNAAASCAGCHGDQGVSSNPAWPSLAGQDARYLANALKAYKDGSRADATMKALAASLDERAINDLAGYYASLRPARPASTTQTAPTKGEPTVAAHVVKSLDERAVDDVASYYASLQPSQPPGSDSGYGAATSEPVLMHSSLVAGVDPRTANNIASYYARFRPPQPFAPGGGPDPLLVHMAKPLDGSSVGGIISYRKDDPSRTAEENNAICLACHERGQRTYWKGSTHEERGVACSECHTIMKNVSAKNQLKTPFEPNTCFQCHKDRQAQIFRSSHMPVREGKIVCSSCHNPHGSAYQGSSAAMLWEDSINDNCYKCHAEKRGPFLFEHAPVRENCLSCHDPHGSINEYSLKMSRPRLCYECHTIGHGQSGRLTDQFIVSRSCQNCHTLIHGSNSPAGAVFQR